MAIHEYRLFSYLSFSWALRCILFALFISLIYSLTTTRSHMLSSASSSGFKRTPAIRNSCNNSKLKYSVVTLLITFGICYCVMVTIHDDIIKWKHFSRYWPFVRGTTGHRWISLTKVRGAELCCIIWSATEKKNGWTNTRYAGDLRRHRAYYDVTVMLEINHVSLTQAKQKMDIILFLNTCIVIWWNLLYEQILRNYLCRFHASNTSQLS